jgi:hypothetical protein
VTLLHVEVPWPCGLPAVYLEATEKQNNQLSNRWMEIIILWQPLLRNSEKAILDFSIHLHTEIQAQKITLVHWHLQPDLNPGLTVALSNAAWH